MGQANERRLKTMKKTMKKGAFALALLGSVALFAGPAVASSIHNEGDFGGGYRIIGPGGPERHDYLRHHIFRPYYDGPAYSYGYGPAWGYEGYDYGPGVRFWGPGEGVVNGY
jgi:hypothetical protein